MRTLIIHPNDPTTEMLRHLYSWLPEDDVCVMDEQVSNSQIEDALQSDEYGRIMLLGHGSEYCLFAPISGKHLYQQFGREIISPRHVQFLRGRDIIGVWCNANIFADRYGLTGLFSGMVISELIEAQQWNINASEDEIFEHREQWAESFGTYLHQHWDDTQVIPGLMNNHITGRPLTHLEQFNYESVYYYINGECQD